MPVYHIEQLTLEQLFKIKQQIFSTKKVKAKV